MDLAYANNNPPNRIQAPIEKSGPNPDLLLIEAYKHLANNELGKAQAKVDELLIAYPNFHLAHLIRGDLIAMRTRPVTRFGAANNAPQDKLKDLNDEAVARLRAITEKPNKDLVPSVLLQLSDEQRYSLVMDAKRARLYLYENIGGVPTLLSDYYVSQGKLGMDKFKEGDQRTPLGVYYITNRLPGAKLPDFYGPGALPLNYPNEWDKLKGRGGSGIWLHGVPSTNYSRAPLASDGCVVLSNPDFLKISAIVDIAKTPVIISDRVEFITRANWNAERQSARRLIDNWQQSLTSTNANVALSLYAKTFKSAANEPATIWFPKTSQVLGKPGNSLKLRDVSQFKYPGKEDIIVSNFILDVQSNRGLSSSKRRQYWGKKAGQWRIVFEESSQIAGPRLESDPAQEVAKATTKETPKAESIAKNATKAESKIALTTTSPKAHVAKSNAAAQTEIAQTIKRWINVWSAKNTKAYLAHYAKDFQTPNGESRKSWMEERRTRIEGKGKIAINIDSPSINVDGNTATVKFRQNYQSGALMASSRKTLTMVKQDGKWLIKQERTGS
ncbi:L,D-transpeptidase family protein [Undibacterium flavidum]|uniref:L,D-transpeptidase family protein n=1 Tax=Undibacterium flavidum TaxID=2762297 RepID=A0ABR6YEL8_9BURK|nr:L,D-transpeptidase family protein [Undibacterium flavidum]MBC3874968.1 L,D-transpeptidase family protein [Undibacterium flavidum]